MNSKLREYVAKLHDLYLQYKTEKKSEDMLSELSLYENKCRVVHNRFMADLIGKVIITKTLSKEEYESVYALDPVKLFHFIFIHPNIDDVYGILIDNVDLFC